MATLLPIQVDILNTQAFRDFVTHADTVATKLVEVICEQEAEFEWWEESLRQWLDADTARLKELRDLRAKIAADIEALHSEYDPSGSGDLWHQCDSANMHDALNRAANIARGQS